MNTLNKTTDTFIEHDFDLPDNSEELLKINETMQSIRQMFNEYILTNTLNNNNYIRLYEKTIFILDCLGNLSTPAFNIENELETIYTCHYPKSPELAKKLWQSHYALIHHPYTNLKNKCFNFLDELDDTYIKKYKKFPPNWKISKE